MNSGSGRSKKRRLKKRTPNVKRGHYRRYANFEYNYKTSKFVYININ